MLPFLLLALGLALRDLAHPAGASPARRVTGQRVVIVFLVVAVLLAAFWYPIITATSVPYEFWRLHNWSPTWI